MAKTRELKTPGAPAAIGPYSQGVNSGGFVFVSGQIALEPGSGELVGGGIVPETQRVLENLKAVLEAAGASLADVIKTTVYMKDLTEFDRMNEVYGRFFKPPYPARATVEVKGLPKGAAVEIDATAFVGKG